jgi:hypothetical protein
MFFFSFENDLVPIGALFLSLHSELVGIVIVCNSAIAVQMSPWIIGSWYSPRPTKGGEPLDQKVTETPEHSDLISVGNMHCFSSIIIIIGG